MTTQVIILRVRLGDTRALLGRSTRTQFAELAAMALEQLPPGAELEALLMTMVNLTQDATAMKELMLRTARRLDSQQRRAKRAGATG